MFNLEGKVALVTGGNGGIGLGMAEGLAQAGARVVIAARNAQKSAAAVEALKALGSDAFALAADLTDEAAVTALFAQMAERCGRLDILINNAGINVRKPPDQLSLAEWHQVMDTNLTSAFLCCRAAYPQLKAAGGGKIINIGSMMSIFGASFAPVYGASKGGIVQLTKSMAAAWAVDNIQVNAVLPGWIQTALTDNARTQVPGLHERVIARTAAGRWGQPKDLAGVAVFLASAASDFLTGTAIPVDGGYSIAG
ncbi:SDR family NAD(P)-dependent oxidoreductase [Variovorax sp. RT4R15]|uniref:SDR family NAD(P)-dependent oxidoreductase n=1 Tax=Variovorax sp. RT4R15 TaxID=3443737 RepID=UPI003F477368